MQGQGDPLVINTIQLLAHKRALDRLLDMVETYKAAVSSGELERMPPLAPPPRPSAGPANEQHPIILLKGMNNELLTYLT